MRKDNIILRETMVHFFIARKKNTNIFGSQAELKHYFPVRKRNII